MYISQYNIFFRKSLSYLVDIKQFILNVLFKISLNYLEAMQQSDIDGQIGSKGEIKSQIFFQSD